MSTGLEKELKIDDVDAKPHTHVYINVWNLQRRSAMPVKIVRMSFGLK
jgi:hypothetical protein